MSDSDINTEQRPYGTWPSPVSAEMVASAGIDFGHLSLDENTVYWREQRPEEDGRGVVVRHSDGTNEDMTPDDSNVRTLVHEYGGGDFVVQDETVFFTQFENQRVYRQSPDSNPVAITPAPETERGLRYADFEVTDDGETLYCVRENHGAAAGEAGVDEPVASLVRLAADGETDPEVIASGHDFYAAPAVSPDGSQLAWLTWDHPRMPWDGTELHIANIEADGTLTNERVVMGGPEESVFQPSWRSDGTLHAVSDRTGWWNLYRRVDEEWVSYRDERAEYGVPQWLFGFETYAFLDDDRVAVIVTREGEQTLEVLSPDASRDVVDVPCETFDPRLRSDGEALYVVGSGPQTPSQLLRCTPGGETEVLRRGSDLELDDAYISTPEHVTVPTRDGADTYAFVYPPTNPDVTPLEDERPPAVVFAHGGPTSATHPAFDLGKQFFTSRGFTVIDVNYRGSTGYGREYREALYGDWGIRDVEDCIDAALALADDGRIDRDRIAIRGGSAGGFIVLAALAFHDEIAAGTSYYGVADLSRLVELTHKFESRYLDQLVGPYPDAAERYDARSPVHHADEIDAPVLLLQGEDDQVVPLSQAEEMSQALTANTVPHDLLVFDDEQHGFRRADSRRRSHEAELAFYGAVFEFNPDDNGLTDLDLTLDENR